MPNVTPAARGRHDLLLSAGLIFALGACGGEGCAGCSLGPLPAGGLPADQTLEGGAQIRVTPAGVAKVEQVIGGAVNDALGDGLCLDEGSQGIGLGDVEYCFNNDDSCSTACQVNFLIDSVDLTPEPGQLRIRTQFDTQIDVPVRFDPIIGPTIGPCTLNVTANNTQVDVIVSLGIDDATGKLTVNLEDIPDLDVDPDINGCSFIGGVLNFISGLIANIVEVGFVRDLLTPLVNDLLQGLLPDPLGLEGVIDVSTLLGSLSPGTRGALEMRLVPGGYAFVEGSGLSLGVIAGINADQDPTTRDAELDSEPALCVPPMVAPDFSAAPASLERTARNTFNLLPAGEFRGQPTDAPDRDVVLGLSETFLDLTGHHAVTSGALCLGLGTQLIPQLNLDTIGVLVPSIAELGSPEGNDPLLLVSRPQRAVDFTAGDGTEESPSLTAHIQGFELDFYAFLFQRYTRGFTISLDLDIGINLEFTTDDQGNPAILPVLVGLDSSDIGITVLNEEFLREDKATLEGLLPSILDLALPLIAEGLPPIALPEFLGFSLQDLTLSKVTTSEDDFLAISATLGTSATLAGLAERYPSIGRSLQSLAAPAVERARSARRPRLVRVDTPAPDAIRAAVRGEGGAMPEVVIDVPSRDDLGRELEWTWNLGGGMWRSFRRESPLVLRDRAFAIQGRYEIELRSRVVGDYRTWSRRTDVVPIVIDSVAPRILAERAAVTDARLRVPAIDLVSPSEDVELAFGSADAEAPATAWGDGSIPVALAAQLAGEPGVLRVWARDQLGNTSDEVVDLGPAIQFHGQDPGGCACDAGGGGDGAGGVALLALAGPARPGRTPGRGRLGAASLPLRRRRGAGVTAGLQLRRSSRRRRR